MAAKKHHNDDKVILDDEETAPPAAADDVQMAMAKIVLTLAENAMQQGWAHDDAAIATLKAFVEE